MFDNLLYYTDKLFYIYQALRNKNILNHYSKNIYVDVYFGNYYELKKVNDIFFLHIIVIYYNFPIVM